MILFINMDISLLIFVYLQVYHNMARKDFKRHCTQVKAKIIENEKKKQISRANRTKKAIRIQDVQKENNAQAPAKKAKKTAKDNYMELERQRALQRWELMEESQKKVYNCQITTYIILRLIYFTSCVIHINFLYQIYLNRTLKMVMTKKTI